MAPFQQVQSRLRHNLREELQMPRQIDKADTDRQGDNAENSQMLITELGQFFRHAADKGRGQRIGQPLHYKYKSNRQKEHAHWRSPFNQFAGAAGAAAGAADLASAALLLK